MIHLKVSTYFPLSSSRLMPSHVVNVAWADQVICAKLLKFPHPLFQCSSFFHSSGRGWVGGWGRHRTHIATSPGIWLGESLLPQTWLQFPVCGPAKAENIIPHSAPVNSAASLCLIVFFLKAQMPWEQICSYSNGGKPEGILKELRPGLHKLYNFKRNFFRDPS